MGKKRCPVCDMSIITKKQSICNACDGRIQDFKKKKFVGEIVLIKKEKSGETKEIAVIPF